MKILIVLAILLSSPNIQARIDAKVNDKDCVIKEIKYHGIYSFVAMQGNCKVIYDMCTRDFCDVEKLETEDAIIQGNIGAVK